MSDIKHTPGPLFVRQPNKWPFNIEIVDAAGEMVFEERRYCYGSNQESIEDVMTCKGFRNTRTDPDFVDRCISANEKQLADAYLRAAAPELLQALQNMLTLHERTGGEPYGTPDIARAAIAKALGGQSC